MTKIKRTNIFYHEQLEKFQSRFQYMCPSLTGATSSLKQ